MAETAADFALPGSVKPYVLVAGSTDPYENLAQESALLDAVCPGECMLYLWQNADTIVLGRNQNAWRECRVAAFERDGGHVARRMSGGGAVYHDVGNLNFTFIACDDVYDVTRQVGVICDAVRALGVDAHLTGRNDIVVNVTDGPSRAGSGVLDKAGSRAATLNKVGGKMPNEAGNAKFSGNAFFSRGKRHCHHGTLMVSVDGERLAHYLNPDPRKLASKGVDSVRSRVVNLSELNPQITVPALQEALVGAFEREYGTRVADFDETRLDAGFLASEQERFASRTWRLGYRADFTHTVDGRFSWGGIEFQLVVEGGIVQQAQVYSDALDAEYPVLLAGALCGAEYGAHLPEALQNTPAETAERKRIQYDCKELIEGLIQ